MKNFILIAFTFATTLVMAGQGISVKPVANNPTCFGTTTGAIQLYVSGGVLPLTFAWNRGLPSTPSQANLAAGIYTVTISDNANNHITKTIELFDPAQISVVATVTDASASNATNGAVNLNVAGGTPGYTFQWNNNSTNENLWDVQSGSYAVTVTDASGCATTITASVNNQLFVDNNTPNTNPSSPSTSGQYTIATGITNVATDKPAVYPNPSTGSFTVKFTENTEAQISLMNMEGQLVYQQKGDNAEVKMNASNLPAGNYVMSVISNGVNSNQLVSIAK